MTISPKNMFLSALCLCVFLSAALITGCGPAEDPAQFNNKSGNNIKHDAGNTVDESDASETPENPYARLGLPYELSELPEGTTAPWPGTISHGAVIKVEHVIDGDTIRNPLASQDNIRLLGMDAPECAKHNANNGLSCDPNNTTYTVEAGAKYPNEPYGAESGQALKDLIALNPNVRIACKMVGNECERDLYKRFLAWIVVETPDGPVDASYYIIEQGLGWTYTSFPTENMAMYCKAEDEAIAARRGMWKDGFDAAYAAVTPETRRWYQSRNEKCRKAQL